MWHFLCLLMIIAKTEALRPIPARPALVSMTPLSPTTVSRISPPALCAAVPHDQPRGLLALAGSNRWRVVSATLLIMLDITFYTFPLPFLGDFLISTGHTSVQVANLVAAFTYSGLVAGLWVLVRELRRAKPRTQRQRYIALSTTALVMAAGAAAQAAVPTYAVLFAARLVQGGATQFAWSSALATAASLSPVGGVKATAWVMAGNSLGEGQTLVSRIHRGPSSHENPHPI